MKLHEIADEDVPLIYNLLKRALEKGKRVILYDFGRELCEVKKVYIDYDTANRTDVMWVDLKSTVSGGEIHSKGYHIPMHMDQLALRPQKDGSLELADTEQEEHDRSMGRME